MKPSELPLAIELALTTQEPIMIWGPPGVGKSQIIYQTGAKHGLPVVDRRLSQMEPSDLSGIPWVVDGSTIWARPEWFPTVETHGERGILFLDEITSAPPQMAAAAYQLVLDRRIGSHVLPDGWLVIAAGNRAQDRGVTHTMPAPLANRFDHYTIEPDLDDLRRYGIQNGWDTRVLAFLGFRPELMHQFDPRSADPAFPTPRAYERISHKLQAGIPDQILNETIKGTIGEGASVEFLAFLGMASQLTPPDVILLNPDTAPLPSDKGIAFATVGALAAKTDRTNIGAAFQYMARVESQIGAEFSVLFARDIGSKDATLASTEAFISWGCDHAEFVL